MRDACCCCSAVAYASRFPNAWQAGPVHVSGASIAARRLCGLVRSAGCTDWRGMALNLGSEFGEEEPDRDLGQVCMPQHDAIPLSRTPEYVSPGRGGMPRTGAAHIEFIKTGAPAPFAFVSLPCSLFSRVCLSHSLACLGLAFSNASMRSRAHLYRFPAKIRPRKLFTTLVFSTRWVSAQNPT